MKGNRLSYEAFRTGCGLDITCRTDTLDYMTWAISYDRGYRPPNYSVPAFPRSTTINPWSVVTFECKECYDHVTREWDFDTQFTPHAEWYRART